MTKSRLDISIYLYPQINDILIGGNFSCPNSRDNNLTNKLGEILPCSKSNYHNW